MVWYDHCTSIVPSSCELDTKESLNTVRKNFYLSVECKNFISYDKVTLSTPT